MSQIKGLTYSGGVLFFLATVACWIAGGAFYARWKNFTAPDVNNSTCYVREYNTTEGICFGRNNPCIRVYISIYYQVNLQNTTFIANLTIRESFPSYGSLPQEYRLLVTEMSQPCFYNIYNHSLVAFEISSLTMPIAVLSSSSGLLLLSMVLCWLGVRQESIGSSQNIYFGQAQPATQPAPAAAVVAPIGAPVALQQQTDTAMKVFRSGSEATFDSQHDAGVTDAASGSQSAQIDSTSTSTEPSSSPHESSNDSYGEFELGAGMERP